MDGALPDPAASVRFVRHARARTKGDLRELKDCSAPATTKAGRRKAAPPAGSRAFLEELAHGVSQCLQLRSRNAELEAIAKHREVMLIMLALALADTSTPCPAEERDACKRRELRNCAQCWLDATHERASLHLQKKRGTA